LIAARCDTEQSVSGLILSGAPVLIFNSPFGLMEVSGSPVIPAAHGREKPAGNFTAAFGWNLFRQTSRRALGIRKGFSRFFSMIFL
jgi:hypothetical protein